MAVEARRGEGGAGEGKKDAEEGEGGGKKKCRGRRWRKEKVETCPQVSCIIPPLRVYQGWKAQKPNCCRGGCTPPWPSPSCCCGVGGPPLNTFSNKEMQMVLGEVPWQHRMVWSRGT